MSEAYVQLTCPSCEKAWKNSPMDLPSPDEDFTCPDCGEQRRTAQFMRTNDDLETLRSIKES